MTAVSLALSLLLYIPDMLCLFENKIFDIFSRLLNPPRASERIVIVQVDQNSIETESQAGNNWPWPRQLYAPIIEFLSEAEAVFVDILYTEPSSYGQEDDQIFSRAIKKAGNVYLPFFLSKAPKGISSQDVAFISRFAVRGGWSGRPRYESLTTPIDVLRESIRGSGNVTTGPDAGDVYRKIPLLFSIKEFTVPGLAFSYFTGRGVVKVAEERIFIDGREVSLIEGNVLLRYFSGKNPFRAFSAEDILDAYRGKNQPHGPTREYFKGKIVFLGLTAPGLFDLKPTPVSSGSTGLSAGVHINATLFDNLTNQTYMRPISGSLVVALMTVIVLFVVFFVLSHPSILRNLAVFLSTFGVVIGLSGGLFINTFYLPTIYPIVTLIISFILSTAYSYASEGKERLFIKRTFSQYMDKTIVDYVLQHPEIIKPGGKKTWLTVLFADIVSFTSIVEKLSPEDTARMLHTILDSLTEVVVNEQGVIDKYIGDCIMAFWGAPIQTADDEINACRAALAFIPAIKKVNRVFRSQGLGEISIRVGLHSGDAIAGNMGSSRLFDYTVIGDTVNLASRLESVNKVFNTRIIISEKILEKTRNLFFTRDLGPIQVLGKSEAVGIYELLSKDEDTVPEVKEKVDLYHGALLLYRQQQFDEAIKQFDAILQQYPDDGPSLFYRNRIQTLAQQYPLTKDWNLIKLTLK
jgi:adenylate cyclase